MDIRTSVRSRCQPWAECRQTLSQFGAADVAGMPYFVARLEVFQIAVVPIGMGVADDSYTFHARFRLLTNCAMNSLVPSSPSRDELMQRS